jgi:hypothetical protein
MRVDGEDIDSDLESVDMMVTCSIANPMGARYLDVVSGRKCIPVQKR